MREKIGIGIYSFICLITVGLIALLLRISPVQLKRSTFVFQLNSELPTLAKDYINANEQVLNECIVNLEGVDTKIIAVYPAYIEYRGEKYPFQIVVEDKSVPIVKLKEGTAVVKCFVGSVYQAKDLVIVEDDSETKIYFEDVDKKQTEEIRLEKEGIFDYYIYAIDTSNNISSGLRIRFESEEDKIAPIISGVENKAIKIGEDFDPLENVTAHDNADGDITYLIKVSNDVNTSKAGQYDVVYTVSDKAGNSTKATRIITVKDDSTTGAYDVFGGRFLTTDKIKERDAIVESLLNGELDTFSNSKFLDNLNTYFANNFTASKNPEDDTSHSAIVRYTGNSYAMARAIKVILDARGIENVIIEGETQGMVWNMVRTDEGYRHLDVYLNATGDDSKAYYLLITDELDGKHRFDTTKYPISE